LPLKDIAATAASLLFRRIREPSVDAISRSALHAPFLPTLIVRGSSAKRWQPPD
jgi:DNA-binding LacI/PurR family transcriptional regulator